MRRALIFVHPAEARHVQSRDWGPEFTVVEAADADEAIAAILANANATFVLVGRSETASQSAIPPRVTLLGLTVDDALVGLARRIGAKCCVVTPDPRDDRHAREAKVVVRSVSSSSPPDAL